MNSGSYPTFDDFFRVATGGHAPYPYQRQLAERDDFPQVLRIPTGLGKTEAVVLAWIWRHLHRTTDTPRRLVYCLPMRVLVEQTRDRIRGMLERLALESAPSVSVLMGGEDDDRWDLYPEREAILVGTQDMLLSRALNRGYGMSRFRWPMHFGLLNNDCLWVMDEVQLMGNGLATSAQLQGLRASFGTLLPVKTLWMSATLRTDWLATADFDTTSLQKLELQGVSDGDLARRMSAGEAGKPLRDSGITSQDKDYPARVARFVQERHLPGTISLIVLNTVERACQVFQSLAPDQPTKGRKGKKFGEMGLERPSAARLLIHSRFRGLERRVALRRLELAHSLFEKKKLKGGISPEDEAWLDEARNRGLVVVSTQVIEAGVDLSARLLVTELAPWASLVQRFGRCNRYGTIPEESGAEVAWIDIAKSKKAGAAAPYEPFDLDTARELLRGIPDGASIAPAAIEALQSDLATTRQSELFRMTPSHVLRRSDLHGLFSTAPDLAGGFTDVSPFVRSADANADVLVFWRTFESGWPDASQPAPCRNELCPVAAYRLADFLKDTKATAWEWDPEQRGWVPRKAPEIRPGMTLLLSRKAGGYSMLLGWTGGPKDLPALEALSSPAPEDIEEDRESVGAAWMSLADHLQRASDVAVAIMKDLNLESMQVGVAVARAAGHHDAAKALPRWQNAVADYLAKARTRADAVFSGGVQWEADGARKFVAQLENCRPDGPLAKFPGPRDAFPSRFPATPSKTLASLLGVRFRPDARHEAASALAAWADWRSGTPGWTALAVYLIAAHHGKVRTQLRGRNGDLDVFGVRQGERLPPLDCLGWDERPLSLRPRELGLGGEWDETSSMFRPHAPSWTAVLSVLLGPELADDPLPSGLLSPDEPQRLGPFLLAFLEAIVRAADAAASKTPVAGRST